MNRILIAGIGNIFLGDDAFGLEVVHKLAQRLLPPEVRVTDFGIRTYDLAYALADGYDAAILVDATTRGERPGTLFLIEPDQTQLAALQDMDLAAHSLNPAHVLRLAEAFGGRPSLVYVVSCEPVELGSNDGVVGLSPPVQAAIPLAIDMVGSIVSRILNKEMKPKTGFVPV
jgi:hydrogenase maturation protease